MYRDLGRLASEEFDVVVAGGGVYALTIARELASRNLTVAIVERDDFAGATSFNSLKTIHGGIRALQHLAMAEMREFVRERRAFATIAPHLIRPLPFVVPTYRHPLRNRPVLSAFLTLYDRLAADRNTGVGPSRALPASRTVGRAECLRLNPAIDPSGVTGGAIWHDYQLHAPERFAVALLDSAIRAGAVAANYAAVEACLVHNGRVTGVRVRDALTGSELHVRGRAVVNATGPWAWALLERSGMRPASLPPSRFSLAMNIVVDHAPLSHAVGGLTGGRFIFMVPWRGHSIIGTSHDEYPGHPAAVVTIAPDRLDPLLADAAAALPGAAIRREDIRLVHRGLLPAVDTRGTVSLRKRSVLHDHALDGIQGLVTAVGVRYTTAGATAREAARLVLERLGRAGSRHEVPVQPLPGGDIPDVHEYERAEIAASGLPADLVRRLIAAYGTGYTALTRMMAEEPGLAAPLSSTCPVLGAEIAHAFRHEMAVHLSDALLRRTAAGTAGHPGTEAVERAAAIADRESCWTPGRIGQEIAALEGFYRDSD